MIVTQSSTYIQVTSPLNFVQIATRSNWLISALNTNVMVALLEPISTLSYYVLVGSTHYFNITGSFFIAENGSPCYLTCPVVPAGFYILSYDESAMNHQFWPTYPPVFEPVVSAIVDGFFGGCTPLDSILASTLDCLYDINCLTIFADYFPALNQVCVRE